MRRIVVVLMLLCVLPAWAGDGAPADSRPELALGRSAEYDYDPPVPGSYRLPAIEPAGDGDVDAYPGIHSILLSYCLSFRPYGHNVSRWRSFEMTA
jgi:hypothetical protein